MKRTTGCLKKRGFLDMTKKRTLAPVSYTHLYRWKVAAFQMYAFQAVNEGDRSVEILYKMAARELALMVKTIKEKLEFSSDSIFVSYSGGLFQVGELILNPFREEVERLGCILKKPSCSAAEGALLLAAEHFRGGC